MINKVNSNRLICFNGEIMPSETATINLMTTTAQYGINVFEGLRAYYNDKTDDLNIFRLEEHLQRLFDSARLMSFELDEKITPKYLTQKIFELVNANQHKEDVYIKIGLFLDGLGSWGATKPISFFIQTSPKGRVFSDIIGVSCAIVSWARINESVIPPRIKAGANYINSRFAHIEAKRNNYDLAIFMNQNGKIAEGTGACIFMVRNNKLVTPPITSSILESITRDTVIQLAKEELNISVEERDIDRTELYLADELFFVGTTIEILPIFSVDRFLINSGSTGDFTKRITERYFETVLGNADNYKNWLKKVII